MKTVIIPSQVKRINDNNTTTTFNVTKIGDNVFKGADAVESATFFCTPDYIGSGAFAGNKLSELYFVNLTDKTAQGVSPLANDDTNFGNSAQPATASEQKLYVKQSVCNAKNNYYLTAAHEGDVEYQIKKVAPNTVNSRAYSATTVSREFPVTFSNGVEVYTLTSMYQRGDENNQNDPNDDPSITAYVKGVKVDGNVAGGEGVLVIDRSGATGLSNTHYYEIADNATAISGNLLKGAYGAVDLMDAGSGYKELPINPDGTQKTTSVGTKSGTVYAFNPAPGKGYFAPYTGAQIPAGKAFILGPASTNPSKGFLMFDLDGEMATAIDRALQAEDDAATWYGLDGAKLEGRPSVKGVYIRNGKKFVVK
jgi:hypothetical protein